MFNNVYDCFSEKEKPWVLGGSKQEAVLTEGNSG